MTITAADWSSALLATSDLIYLVPNQTAGCSHRINPGMLLGAARTVSHHLMLAIPLLALQEANPGATQQQSGTHALPSIASPSRLVDGAPWINMAALPAPKPSGVLLQ